MTFYLTRLFFAIAWVSCGGTSSRVLHTAPTIFQRFSSGFCRQRGADALSACSTTFPTLMGLKNLGYTCYLNSVIQALHHCEQFSEAVNIASYQHGTAGKELQSLFRQLDAGFGPVTPVKLIHRLDAPTQTQEDAQEYFLRILDMVGNMRYIASRLTTGVDPSAAFEGELKYAHGNSEIFKSISIPVLPSTVTLQQGIDEYFNSARISRFPDLFSMDLKRFYYDAISDRVKKIGQRIEFDQQIDLSKYEVMTETSGSYAIKHAYDLKAVIVHIGEANYGHYISFLRHNITDDESVWLRCDDEIVEAVPFSVVAAESFGDELPAGRSGKAEASRTAYVLIFQRRKES